MKLVSKASFMYGNVYGRRPGMTGGIPRGRPGGDRLLVHAESSTRRLILLRHADSDSGPGRDHERPISSLGRVQSIEFIKMLSERGGEAFFPHMVLASNSRRSKETLQEMETIIEGLRDIDQLFFGSLYTINSLDGQSREEIERLILEHADDEKHKTIMVLGHNKGMEEAASSMTGREVKLKSASAALLEAASTVSSWKDLIGYHISDLTRASRDEDWENHGESWKLIDVLSPTSST
jgi:phosphohistidine phosphatase